LLELHEVDVEVAGNGALVVDYFRGGQQFVRIESQKLGLSLDTLEVGD